MIRPILQVPHIALSTPAIEATPETTNAKQLRDDLVDTLADSKIGIGLAANQIGVLVRALVLKTAAQGVVFMMNPRYAQVSHFKVSTNEQCLSVPGFTRQRSRARSCKVTYFDKDWKRCYIHLTDIEAVCFAHENDHINGITIADK